MKRIAAALLYWVASALACVAIGAIAATESLAPTSAHHNPALSARIPT